MLPDEKNPVTAEEQKPEDEQLVKAKGMIKLYATAVKVLKVQLAHKDGQLKHKDSQLERKDGELERKRNLATTLRGLLTHERHQLLNSQKVQQRLQALLKNQEA